MAYVQKIIHGIAHFIATVAYAGCLPKAPGTFGSLAAFPLYFLLPQHLFRISIPFLFVIGLAVTYILLVKDGSDKDPSFIVIDELYAMMLVLAILPSNTSNFSSGMSWFFMIVAFVLFRFFDILKPWPIGFIDHYFENKDTLGASFGVMIDDFIAALFSIVILIIIRTIFL